MKELVLLTLFTIIKNKQNVKCLIFKKNLCNLKGVMICDYDKERDIETNLCGIAAEVGDLFLLKYLFQNGYEWDDWTPSYAAYNGNLSMLIYAYDNGCKWSSRTAQLAAFGGSIECLKYVFERWCPLDSWVTACAAQGGHLECLKYLHEHGCKWDKETTQRALYYGHLECLKYAHEKGCEWDKDMLIYCVDDGCREFICHVEGYSWDKAFLNTKPGEHDECLKYVNEH